MASEEPVHLIETLVSLEVDDDLFVLVWRSDDKLFVTQRGTGARLPLVLLEDTPFHALVCIPERFNEPAVFFTLAVIIRSQSVAKEQFLSKKQADGKPWVAITHRTLLPGEAGKPRSVPTSGGSIRARTISLKSAVRQRTSFFGRPRLVTNPSLTYTP
jgi:hypothetical protein